MRLSTVCALLLVFAATAIAQDSEVAAEFDEAALEAVDPAVLATLNAFLLQNNATQGIEATILNRRNKLPKTRNPVDRAFRSNSLGFGFSGSGFLMIYFWGLHSVMQATGLYNPNTIFAGSSGGSIAAAMGCSQANSAQFGGVAFGAAAGCLLANNCDGILDAFASFGLNLFLPANVVADCGSRLFVSTTHARPNFTPGIARRDREVKINAFADRQTVIEAILASSYVPGFSGPTNVKDVRGAPTLAPGVNFVYDGVGTNPLPVPPRGTTYDVAVSALVPNPQTPNQISFPELLTRANDNPGPSPADRRAPFNQFIPLDPINSTIGVHQRLDIYPGISTGGTPILSLGRQWNDFFLVAPTPADVVAIYGQGRADAIWWITHNFANNPTVLSAVANSIDNTLLTRANLDALQSTLPAPPPGLLG